MLTIILMLALIIVAGWLDSRLDWQQADRADRADRAGQTSQEELS